MLDAKVVDQLIETRYLVSVEEGRSCQQSITVGMCISVVMQSDLIDLEIECSLVCKYVVSNTLEQCPKYCK